MGLFDRLKSGLGKTRGGFTGKITSLLTGRKIDEDLFEELEEALIMADLGVQTTMDIVENLRKRVKREHATDPSVIKDMLIDEITAILEEGAEEAESLPSPSVLLVIGVVVKGWMSVFYRRLGKMSDNPTLLAAAKDSMGDAVSTTVITLAALVSRLTGWPLDGYAGVLVALLVSLITWVQADISQSFTLWQTKL